LHPCAPVESVCIPAGKAVLLPQERCGPQCTLSRPSNISLEQKGTKGPHGEKSRGRNSPDRSDSCCEGLVDWKANDGLATVGWATIRPESPIWLFRPHLRSAVILRNRCHPDAQRKDPQLHSFATARPGGEIKDADLHEGCCFAFVMASRTLYAGVTGKLSKGVLEHKDRVRRLPQSDGSNGGLKSNCGSFRCASG